MMLPRVKPGCATVKPGVFARMNLPPTERTPREILKCSILALRASTPRVAGGRAAEEGADDKDMKRGVMAFRPVVAPIKCAVFPLSSQAAFYPLCNQVMDALGKLHLRWTNTLG